MTTKQTESFLSQVAISELLSQIAVTQPYFAFEHIEVTAEGGLSAVIPPLEEPMDSECGIRAAAEVGRHLAILGSCAAARLNQKAGKHFYLAKNARLRSTQSYQDRVMRNDLDALQSGRLLSFAHAEFTGARNAKADVRIVSEVTNEELYLLDVDYTVLTPRAFERFFAAHRVDEYEQNANVYRDLVQFDQLVEDLFLIDNLLSARFGFQPASCAGHFPTFPALPVAVLMYILSKAAGTLLEEVSGRPAVPYIVVDADICAENLAFPDEKLYLVVQHTADDIELGRHVFECRALAEGNQQHKFGEMTLVLQIVEPM